jgi:hypothetical protein
LCETSSREFGIFYHKLWTNAEDFQVTRLVYVLTFLQNSSSDKTPKNLKQNPLINDISLPVCQLLA